MKILTDITEVLKSDIDSVFGMEQQIADAEIGLMQIEQFQNFIRLQKEFKERSAVVWKTVEEKMIQHDIKSIKGDWGSITIAERTSFDYDKTILPKKFYKVSIDESKVLGTYKLEGSVKGATPKFKKYLSKRLK